MEAREVQEETVGLEWEAQEEIVAREWVARWEALELTADLECPVPV
jgi:hypothetical protein